jgi:hypothetical protein
LIEVVGSTPDGRQVVSGVFSFYETNGMPLDALFETLRNQGLIPDWSNFMIEAVEAGMNPDRVIAMLDPAIADSFGGTLRDVVVVRLRSMTEGTDEELPQPTVALRLLPSEYEIIYGRLTKLGHPSFRQMMLIVGEVLGSYVVERMQGEVVGFEVVKELPEDRFLKL